MDLARFEGWIRGFVALESWFRMHPELDVEAAKAMAMDCLAICAPEEELLRLVSRSEVRDGLYLRRGFRLRVDAAG